MNRTGYLCLMSIACLAASCSEGLDEASPGTRSEALNGDLTSSGNLTRKGSPIANLTDENARRADSDLYYDAIKIGSNGTGQKAPDAIGTLAKFRSFYEFDQHEYVARYYNRGDLGIGREMHCSDGIVATSGYVACYVTNFAAGDDNTEYTFGLSKSIAFDNMANNHPFATVAMAFRISAPANQKVFFYVYDKDGNQQNFAALDRHAQNFLNTGAGTPGTTFNNHVPTNCMNCHGGSYDAATHTGSGSLFLPFDLEQFELDARFGDQSAAFRGLNALVRDVATLSGSSLGGKIAELTDKWHGTYSFHSYAQDFDANAVPDAWADPADIGVYRAVIRPMCRNCHVTSPINFADPASLVNQSERAVADLCSFQMPHALQTVREFWLSNAPATLANYLWDKGKTGDASTLRACGPKNVVTLDPPQISAAAF